MRSRRTLALVCALIGSLLAAGVAYSLADGYIDRLPNHAGYYLVAVDDSVERAPRDGPERAILVLVDGLRRDSATSMQVTKRLSAIGQCRRMNTGALTISRPVYTIVSTGVEADRTGARNNDETRPVAVQSIWQVARAAGWNVSAASDVPWWKQLFPGAFSSYLLEPDVSVNLFANAIPARLMVIHPSRVDSAGHRHGASSRQYREAVQRTDQEALAFLETLDFTKDLLIFTADHGHSASGGHGGPAREIAQVLTCFAGPGVRPGDADGVLDARMIAPTLSVLLGLPFPRHMRAVQDSLEEIWSVVDAESIGAEYSEERKRGIEKFRKANRAQLGRWLGKRSGRWSELYARERLYQSLWWLGFGALALMLLGMSYRARGLGLRGSLASSAWMLGVMATIIVSYTWVRGSFDFTSINQRGEFLSAALAVCGTVGFTALGIHALLWRDMSKALADLLTLSALGLGSLLAHHEIFEAPLGFPLPGRIAIFWPFIGGVLVLSMAGLAGLVSLAGIALETSGWRKTGEGSED